MQWLAGTSPKSHQGGTWNNIRNYLIFLQHLFIYIYFNSVVLLVMFVIFSFYFKYVKDVKIEESILSYKFIVILWKSKSNYLIFYLSHKKKLFDYFLRQNQSKHIIFNSKSVNNTLLIIYFFLLRKKLFKIINDE